VAQSKYDHKLNNIAGCNGGIGWWPKASMVISLVKLLDATVELALVTQSKHGHKLGKNCRMQRWNWLVTQSKHRHKLGKKLPDAKVELALVTQSKHVHKLGNIAGCKGGIGS
jgi:hypothetical protein